MNLQQLKTKYKNSILKIAKQRNIDNIRIFGSVVHNNNNNKSDIDFLIHLLPNASLIDLSGFQFEIEKLLNCKTDVIPDNSIHWSIKDKVISEALPL